MVGPHNLNPWLIVIILVGQFKNTLRDFGLFLHRLGKGFHNGRKGRCTLLVIQEPHPGNGFVVIKVCIVVHSSPIHEMPQHPGRQGRQGNASNEWQGKNVHGKGFRKVLYVPEGIQNRNASNSLLVLTGPKARNGTSNIVNHQMDFFVVVVGQSKIRVVQYLSQCFGQLGPRIIITTSSIGFVAQSQAG